MRKGIVSVIVPIYNAGIYLEKCLNLLLRADDFFEIILIDDGSTDDSLSVCQMYAQNKKNVQVIHQSNGGVSSARNRGIKEARGEWICFVDSDDVLVENWAEVLKENLMLHPNADIILFSVGLDNKKYVQGECIKGALGIQVKDEQVLPTLSWVYSKLYKKSVLTSRGILFEENLINGEDMIFNCKCFSVVDFIVGVNKSYYFYNKNLASSTNSFNEKIYITEIEFHKSLSLLIKDYFPKDYDWQIIYEATLLNGIYAIIYRISLSKKKVDLDPFIRLLEMPEYKGVIENCDNYKLSWIKKRVIHLIKKKSMQKHYF